MVSRDPTTPLAPFLGLFLLLLIQRVCHRRTRIGVLAIIATVYGGDDPPVTFEYLTWTCCSAFVIYKMYLGVLVMKRRGGAGDHWQLLEQELS